MAVTPQSVAIPPRHDAPATAPRAPATAPSDSGFWGADGLTFGDILDLINPLQHVPIVSTLYRSFTGDDISTGARVLGGALFGGVIGLFAAVFNAILDDATGKDVGDHALAMLDDAPAAPGDAAPGESLFARATPAAPGPAPRAASADAAGGAPANPRDAADPPWLSRMPRAGGDFAALAARYGDRPAAGWVLEAMGEALDKYESLGGAIDAYRHRPTARHSQATGVNIVL